MRRRVVRERDEVTSSSAHKPSFHGFAVGKFFVHFSSWRSELTRVLTLLVTTYIVEVFVVSGALFRLLKASAQWPPFPQLLLLVMPRFVVMVVLVTVLGHIRERVWIVVFFVGYGALLLLRFEQAEVFTDWGSAMGACRATLPYFGGLIGAMGGFWLRSRFVLSRGS